MLTTFHVLELGLVAVVLLFTSKYLSHLEFWKYETKNLNEEHAVRIYERKIVFMQSISGASGRDREETIRRELRLLGARYQVDPRVIRDVWNRKTWVISTSRLWTNEQSVD